MDIIVPKQYVTAYVVWSEDGYAKVRVTQVMVSTSDMKNCDGDFYLHQAFEAEFPFDDLPEDQAWCLHAVFFSPSGLILP